MDAVDRIKEICRERKIPFSRMEKDLGFSNGYMGQLKSGQIRIDRLVAIADYLGVSTNYLLTGEEIEKPATDEGDGLENLSENQIKLIRLIHRLTDEESATLLEQVKEQILGL